MKTDKEYKEARRMISQAYAPAGCGLFSDEIDNIVPIVAKIIKAAREEEKQKIRDIFNRCKTERGLTRALSNYLTPPNN